MDGSERVEARIWLVRYKVRFDLLETNNSGRQHHRRTCKAASGLWVKRVGAMARKTRYEVY